MDTSPHLPVVTLASLVLHYTVYYVIFSSQRSPTHIVHINEFHYKIMYGHIKSLSQCVYVSVFFTTLCRSTPPHGDPWAMAISRLTLTTITRLDSVCQVQDAA